MGGLCGCGVPLTALPPPWVPLSARAGHFRRSGAGVEEAHFPALVHQLLVSALGMVTRN